MNDKTNTKTKPEHLDLTIRATNGSPWETHEFKTDETVQELIDKAVKHFEHEKVMQPGDYDIVLVVDGVAQPPLDPADEIADTGIREHSILALTPHEPQVDG